MGYTSAMFEEIGKLELPSKTILDVGAQDVRIPSAAEVNQLNQFIEKHNPGKEFLKIEKFPCIIEAKEIYVKAGFDYTSIDVDERPYTLRVDLAKFEIPKSRGQFGLVVNVGTTEHLSSPVAAFALMHEMCTKGGFFYHDVPVFGFGNHGLTNLTPKFWHALIWMNSYAIQGIRLRKVDESTIEKGNFYHDYLAYMEGLNEITQISYMITALLQKQHDKPFYVPYDAIFPDSDSGFSLAKLLFGSFYPFLKTGAYTSSEVINGINNFLKRQRRKYRVTSLDELNQLDDSSNKSSPNAHNSLTRLLRKLIRMKDQKDKFTSHSK